MAIFTDEYGLKEGWLVTFILLSAIVLAIGLPTIIWSKIQVPAYKDACYNYSEVTGREVKYSRPNFNTAVCFVKTPNGWFDIDQINQNNVTQK